MTRMRLALPLLGALLLALAAPSRAAEAPAVVFDARAYGAVGDDATDEHGFEAVAATGGFGILVGPPRETAASFRLAGVEQVLGWLEAAL